MKPWPVIIPLAGRGRRMAQAAATRLGPGRPKHLLPLSGRPILQHALEMVLASECEEIYLVVPRPGGVIEQFLTAPKPPPLPYPRQEAFFERINQASLNFVVQEQPLGLAEAISRCRNQVGPRPFGLIMADNFFQSETPFLSQLEPTFAAHQKPIIGGQHLRPERLRFFGNVGLIQKATMVEKGLYQAHNLSPKQPHPANPKGRGPFLKGAGGGIFTPDYFDIIDKIRPTLIGEIDDVPVLQELIRQGRLLVKTISGEGFDCGLPQGYEACRRFLGDDS